MRKAPLTNPVVPYDASWVSAYRQEAARLAPLFGTALVAITHVGSTAVPGLAAKPEIDILVEVNRADDVAEALANLGYRRGRDLSPGHQFYKKERNGRRSHKLHLCLAGHRMIGDMKHFLDVLLTSRETRDAYEVLKLSLVANNTQGIAEYLDGKAPFIQRILSRAAERARGTDE
ncbi:MAG: GrpB family protein [Pseudomonadota bacterium]